MPRRHKLGSSSSGRRIRQDGHRIRHGVLVDKLALRIPGCDVADVGRLILPCTEAEGAGGGDRAPTDIVVTQRDIEYLGLIQGSGEVSVEIRYHCPSCTSNGTGKESSEYDFNVVWLMKLTPYPRDTVEGPKSVLLVLR